MRAGLAPPQIPPQTLHEFLNDLCSDDAKAISGEYIGRVRDAMAELVLQFQDSDFEMALDSEERKSENVFINHIHDEALARNSRRVR